MQMINEKLAPVNALVANYPIRWQVLGLIGIEMCFVFLLWIIPPPITAPFDIAAFVAFIIVIVAVLREIQPIINYVKYIIIMHLFILVLYLLVYEVIFNWIVTPGKKEQKLGVIKIILIIFSCIVDGILYIKWVEFTSGTQPQPDTDFPETVTSTDPNAYNPNQTAYQETPNY